MPGKKHGFLYRNGLSLAALALFAFSLLGQALAGLAVYNGEAKAHGEATLGFLQYLVSGQFIEAVFENWESEFLQMAVFIVLTKYLRQWGSSESKRLDGMEAVDEDPRKHAHEAAAPWPVRKGGLLLAIYGRSLALTFFALFAASMAFHAYGGVRAYNQEQARLQQPQASQWEYLGTSQFWFESFQNWQSEFLSVAALFLLSIYLRDRGSPQSKPVAKANNKTENE